MYFLKAHTSAFMSHICILAFKKEFMYPYMFKKSICIHIRMYFRENKTECIAEFICIHTCMYFRENKTEFVGECIYVHTQNIVSFIGLFCKKDL